jgi:hypothetical protein
MICSHFVIVDERVILTDFTNKVLSVLFYSPEIQMVLNNVEHFLFYIVRRVNVKLTWWHHEQELLVVSLGCWKSNHFEHCVQTSIDLVLEATLLSVVYDGKVRVADPGIDQLFVEFTSLFNCLISCLVVLICIKLGCSIGR